MFIPCSAAFCTAHCALDLPRDHAPQKCPLLLLTTRQKATFLSSPFPSLIIKHCSTSQARGVITTRKQPCCLLQFPKFPGCSTLCACSITPHQKETALASLFPQVPRPNYQALFHIISLWCNNTQKATLVSSPFCQVPGCFRTCACGETTHHNATPLASPPPASSQDDHQGPFCSICL